MQKTKCFFLNLEELYPNFQKHNQNYILKWKDLLTPFSVDEIILAIKKYRKLNALSVSDVVYTLSERYGVNVAEKTVYGWESNQAQPTASMLVALCDIYKINNVSDIFSEKVEPRGFAITPEERTLIERYRQNRDMQQVIRKLLDFPK